MHTPPRSTPLSICTCQGYTRASLVVVWPSRCGPSLRSAYQLPPFSAARALALPLLPATFPKPNLPVPQKFLITFLSCPLRHLSRTRQALVWTIVDPDPRSNHCPTCFQVLVAPGSLRELGHVAALLSTQILS
ncbi:hypothetical protein TRVL_05802 [Trypanosoma vivax]|nr:hypothetical protein TRVL_05802 [Trypanosoma vivax]